MPHKSIFKWAGCQWIENVSQPAGAYSTPGILHNKCNNHDQEGVQLITIHSCLWKATKPGSEKSKRAETALVFHLSDRAAYCTETRDTSAVPPRLALTLLLVAKASLETSQDAKGQTREGKRLLNLLRHSQPQRRANKGKCSSTDVSKKFICFPKASSAESRKKGYVSIFPWLKSSFIYLFQFLCRLT